MPNQTEEAVYEFGVPVIRESGNVYIPYKATPPIISSIDNNFIYILDLDKSERDRFSDLERAVNRFWVKFLKSRNFPEEKIPKLELNGINTNTLLLFLWKKV